jgi:alkaline phosphatase
MKFRNLLLALGCLLAFGALGYWYVQAWVVQKPFGIVVFVSDGLVARHLTIARLYKGGAEARLTLESFPAVAMIRNSAKDFAVPDDAAAATALATGGRVPHRAVAVNSDGEPLESILTFAKREGRAVGVISTDSITAATPAAFYAHSGDPLDGSAVAARLVDGFRPDVLLGGGAADFAPESKGGLRKDQRDLLKELTAQGVEVAGSKADLEQPHSVQQNLVGLFSPGALSFSDQVQSGTHQPSLTDMVRRAIVILQQNRNGYVLVVDAALVTHAAQRNEAERTIRETLALDDAVEAARRFAGEKSLIIAVGKHSTGGLALNGYPLRHDHGVALLGSNAAGYPYLTWATGPNGPTPPSQTPLADSTAASEPSTAKTEPAAFQTPSALNNAEDVLAVATGPGSEKLRGWLSNTEIFSLLKEAL